MATSNTQPKNCTIRWSMYFRHLTTLKRNLLMPARIQPAVYPVQSLAGIRRRFPAILKDPECEPIHWVGVFGSFSSRRLNTVQMCQCRDTTKMVYGRIICLDTDLLIVVDTLLSSPDVTFSNYKKTTTPIRRVAPNVMPTVFRELLFLAFIASGPDDPAVWDSDGKGCKTCRCSCKGLSKCWSAHDTAKCALANEGG